MSDVNKVIIIGNVAKNPEWIGEGKKAASFRVATNAEYRTSTGENRKITDYHGVKVFGKDAAEVMANVNAGTRVMVEGKNASGDYTNREGKKVYTYDIKADHVIILSAPPRGVSGSQGMDPEDDIPF